MVFDRGYKTEDLVEHSLKAVDEGFDAIKINFITYNAEGGRLGFLKGPIHPKTCLLYTSIGNNDTHRHCSR